MNIKNKWMLTQQLLPFLIGGGVMFSACVAQAAGGTQLGATRLIYPQGKQEVSITLSNTSTTANYLIQCWVADADGRKVSDFVVTPPLFVAKPKTESMLRVLSLTRGANLPTDRESVSYLHCKSIPSVPKNSGVNVLQIAVESVIKIFVRPPSLPSSPDGVSKSLRCNLSGSALTLTNPSPYYASLVNLNVGTRKQENTMVPPKGSTTLTVSDGARGAVTYQALNDFGGLAPKTTCGAG